MRRLFALLFVALAAPALAQTVQPGQKVSLNGTGSSAQINMRGDTIVVVQIQGSWSGTLTFNGSLDGSSYNPINLTPLNSSTAASTTTSDGLFSGTVSGLNFVQVFATSGGGGAVVSFTTFYASTAAGGGGGGGGGTQYATGAAVTTPTGTVALGYDGTNVRAVATAANGHEQVDCSNCSGSGASNTDNTVFTQGTNAEAPAAGLYTTSWSNPTSGRSTIFRSTINGGIFSNIDTVGGSTITLGQTTMASSFPVAIASNQGAVPASQSGNWTARIVGNAGGIVDFAGQNAASPANAILLGGQFNTSPSTITSGNVSPIQLDNGGRVIVNCASGCGGSGGTSIADNATFTQGSTSETPAAGLASTNDAAYSSATTGHATIWQMSLKGHGIVDIGNGSATGTVNGTANTALVAGVDTNNTNAAGTNRIATLDGIAQTSYANGTAYTQGRDVSADVFTDGALHVAALPAMRPASYTASSGFAGSSTTDNAVLPGNATNTVLVTDVMVTCTQTTAGSIHLQIIKRSAADTSGTSASMTVVPDDSNYSAGQSAPLSYTGTGPSVGAAVGNVDDVWVGCNAPATAGPNDVYIGNFHMKPIVLRGTAQQLAVNFGGAITGGNITVRFKWIETTTITP